MTTTHAATTDAHPRDRVTTLLHCRLLRGAAFAFVSYKAVYDGLTADAGLVADAVASALVAAGLCAALLLCRRLPVAVAGVALAGFLLESQIWPVLIALYCVTVRRPAPVAIGLTALAFVPAAYAPFRELVNMPQVTYLPCAVVTVPLAFGLAARSHQRLARSLARQLDHLEAANRLRDERVRLSERARIAREMHDVLAHRLSLLVLHTGVPRAARCSPRPSPARSSAASTAPTRRAPGPRERRRYGSRRGSARCWRRSPTV